MLCLLVECVLWASMHAEYVVFVGDCVLDMPCFSSECVLWVSACVGNVMWASVVLDMVCHFCECVLNMLILWVCVCVCVCVLDMTLKSPLLFCDI